MKQQILSYLLFLIMDGLILEIIVFVVVLRGGTCADIIYVVILLQTFLIRYLCFHDQFECTKIYLYIDTSCAVSLFLFIC